MRRALALCAFLLAAVAMVGPARSDDPVPARAKPRVRSNKVEGAMVGEWSAVVRGIRARLVTSLDDLDRGAPFVSVYVEFEHVYQSASDIEIGAGRRVEIELLDEAMKPVPSAGFPYDGPVPSPVAVVLPNHSRMRCKVSYGGCGSPPGGVMVCFLQTAWFLPDTDRRSFYVRGSVRREGKDPGGTTWIGRLDLPPTLLDREPGPKEDVATPGEALVPAASIPAASDEEDVVDHLVRYHTGDEQNIREIASRLEGRVARPWTVERLAAAFAAALDPKQRADLVYLLAASKTSLGLRVAGNSLDHDELDTRVEAAMGIARYWIKVMQAGGLEQTMISAASFWQQRAALDSR